MNDKKTTVHIHILSDATGLGNERLARAALVQFRDSLSPIFHRHAFVTSENKLIKVLDEVEAHRGVLLYTMNDKHLRRCLDDAQYDRAVEFVDMLGPIMKSIGRRFKIRPLLDSDLLADALGAKELQVAQAIDFTLAHDDGQGVETIDEADVLILGISRTSKTPTSIYVSSHFCLKVANIPIIHEMDLPAEIFSLPKTRVIGLKLSPQKLAHVRRNRFKPGTVENYCDIPQINRELRWADHIFQRIDGIRIINATDRTVEEVANMIVEDISL